MQRLDPLTVILLANLKGMLPVLAANGTIRFSVLSDSKFPSLLVTISTLPGRCVRFSGWLLALASMAWAPLLRSSWTIWLLRRLATSVFLLSSNVLGLLTLVVLTCLMPPRCRPLVQMLSITDGVGVGAYVSGRIPAGTSSKNLLAMMTSIIVNPRIDSMCLSL